MITMSINNNIIKHDSVKPNLCKNCKFYKKNLFQSYKDGKCTYFKNINEIDGKIKYDTASFIRINECFGQLFQKKNHFPLYELLTIINFD